MSDDDAGPRGEGERRRRRRRRGGERAPEPAAGGERPTPAPGGERPATAADDARPTPAAGGERRERPRGDARPPRPPRDARPPRPSRDAGPARAARPPRDARREPPREGRDARRERPRDERPRDEHRERPRDARPAAADVDLAWEEHEPAAPAAAAAAPPDDDDAPAPPISLGPDLPPEPADDDPDPASADVDDAPVTALARAVANLAGVRLAATGKIYWCDAGAGDYRVGDRVVVDGERSTRLATVAVAPARRGTAERPTRTIVRRATDADRAAEAREHDHAARVLARARARVRELRAPCKVFRVEYTHPPDAGGRGGKLNLYYTSDERVELRELLRDLGAATGARIELRQVGVRDEAKHVGGIGSCGLELCCTTWLPDFVPVSIKMAKDQGLVLNPTKVAGQCGRLKCCLVYEQATYAELRKGLPKLGKRVITASGEGRVVEVDVLRQRVRVAFGPGESQVLPAAEVTPMFPAQRPGRRGEAEADLEAEGEAEAEAEAEPGSEPEPDPEPGSDPESDPESDPDPASDPDPEPS